MTQTPNAFAPLAHTLPAATVAFIDANRTSDNASTPFARSLLATVVGGVTSLAMVESIVIGAFGSPKSPKTGKPVAKVSGLRDMEGGARLYQAFKAVTFILENIDADATPISEDTPAANAIRPLVTAFILGEANAPKALFGPTGVHAMVKDAMTAHAKAIAAHNGVEADADAAPEAANDDAAPATLADRIAVMLVALKATSDVELLANADAIQLLSDTLIDRYNVAALADLATQEAIAA